MKLIRTNMILSVVAILVVSAGAYGVKRNARVQTLDGCQANLKQYALGVMMYCQDYDERFPPMKYAAPLKRLIQPYVKNDGAFSCPVTQQPFEPNPALNYVNLKDVAKPAMMVLLRDARAHTEDAGKKFWNVAYADGHVKRVDNEPILGKPAPTPVPSKLTRIQQIQKELAELRRMRVELDMKIRQLEAESQQRSKRL